MKTLFINSSIMGASKAITEEYLNKNEMKDVTILDINNEFKGQLSQSSLNEWYGDTAKYIELLKAHDNIVIASPMINFFYSPVLKSFIDKITLSGTTFKYTESGVEPMIEEFGSKKLILFLTSGTQKDYLPKPAQSVPLIFKEQMKFIGFKDVEVKWFSGTNAPSNYGKTPQELVEVFKEQI